MITHNLDFGKIFEFPTKEEAREFWYKEPSKRGQIWLTEEIELCMLASPERLKAINEMKMKKPGTIVTKEMLAALEIQ